MLDQDLFKELVKKKLIDASVAEKILKEAKLSNLSAEAILYRHRLVNEVEVAKTKGEILNAPYKKIDPAAIPDELFKLISKETSENYRTVPIEKKDNLLIVGMLNSDDLRAQEALKFIAKTNGLNLGVFTITPSDLAAVWRRYAPYKTEVEIAVRELGEFEPSKYERKVGLEEEDKTTEAPVIKIVASTLKQAVELGASDIHFEPQRSRLRIRFRLDGKLQEVVSLPSSLIQSIISRVKVLARLKLDETRIPQDGRFRTTVFGRDIDYRVATFPTPSGEKAAIRVLDSQTGLKSLEDLGLVERNFNVLTKAIEAPFGMILITGPTGSGKTTTLYSLMNRLNSEDVNVMSLEDPVEYFIEGVNQSQVRPEIGYSFASGLRQILRQDPDVIMVGEIRDSETAGLAVNAALTGHIVLSTLHTNNALGVVPRLINLGVPPFLLPSSLNVMVSQRLVLKICPNCREKTEPAPAVQEIIEEELKNLPKSFIKNINNPPYYVFKLAPQKDCIVCKGKGTAGRIALFEIFKMTKELSEIISHGFTENQLLEEAKRQEMITLRQDGIIKALGGIVAIEEVLRETE